MSIKKIINWFIPPRIQADEQLNMRARSNVAVSFVLGFAAVVYGFLFSIMHHPMGAVVIVALVAVLILPAPFILRIWGSVKVTGNSITLAMFLIQVYLAVSSGGIHAQSVAWFSTVPILAALLVGFGYGIFWGFLSAAAVAALYVMEISGYTFHLIPLSPGEDLTFRFIVFTGLVLIVMGFTLLFEGLKNNAFKRSQLSFTQLKTAFAEITENAEILAFSASELTTASESIEQNASDSLEKVSQMAAGTNEANQNIHTLASSIEQVSGGVQDISRSTGEAAEVSKKAVKMVDSINKMVAKLDENNKDIGKMTTLITDIAFQTNLLALNAAIEAARAGEAGRGFAVVAGAVRTLSLEASEAANKISDKIKAVQEDTETAIENIRQVNETIYKFNDLMNYIASAIAEQTGTLTEMSQHAGKAADETSRIAESSQSVSIAAESTSKGINDVLAAAKELTHMAETLRAMTQQTA